MRKPLFLTAAALTLSACSAPQSAGFTGIGDEAVSRAQALDVRQVAITHSPAPGVDVVEERLRNGAVEWHVSWGGEAHAVQPVCQRAEGAVCIDGRVPGS
jgi:hypothetical protein